MAAKYYALAVKDGNRWCVQQDLINGQLEIYEDEYSASKAIKDACLEGAEVIEVKISLGGLYGEQGNG